MSEAFLSRRVVFPLKIKLVVIMAALLVSSISLYAIFALNLFEKDKSAYIYGNSSEANLSFNNRVSNYLSSTFDKLQILSYMPIEKVGDILGNYQDVLHLDIYKDGEQKSSFYNQSQIENLGHSVEEYKRIVGSLNIQDINGFIIFKDQLESYLVLKYFNKENSLNLIMFLRTNYLESILSSFSQYDSYILNPDGTAFYGDISKNYFKEIKEKSLKEATIEVDPVEPKILSYIIDAKFKLIFISEISKKEAYKVNEYLLGKSKIFGLVLLSLSGFIALLFSRSLTSPLEKLYDLTLSISKGEFTKKAEISSRDEIGALGDSFNYMSEEILRYMDEMKEKARLENEIETAKYVQSTYFPNENLNLNSFNISSFYKPASECGGDWWGYYESEKFLTVVITDATGHGVPAALLTATAHCCLENLKQGDESIIRSPEKVLEFMNRSIQCLEGKMLMTAFCCVFDKERGEVLYSNASHNPPLYRGFDYDVNAKNNFKPLLGSNGPRLGHKEFGDYKVDSIDISEVERVLLFTDGILESKNSEDRDYGQRRFLKSLNANIAEANDVFRDNIVSGAFDFYGDIPIDDDVTIVSVKSEDIKKEEATKSGNIDDLELKTLLDKSLKDECKKYVTDKVINDSRFVFISSREDCENISILKENESINHLVGRNSPHLFHEIQHNIENYKESLSLGEYLGEAHFHNTTVREKSDFEKINNLLGTLDADGYFESPIDYLKIISNELLTNALYHSGKGSVFNERSEMDRQSSPILGEDEHIDYSLAVGREFIAICVIDFTGRLDREVIVSNLERSFREREHQNKNGGAGLGLFLAFSYSNQFIVRRRPGVSTEVICIIEKNKRFKTYKERITSFHYFEEQEKV